MKIEKYNKMRKYQNYKWKKEKLYYFSTPMEISLEKHEIYPDMYYINFPEGKSRDFYNLTRAKDLAQKVASLDHFKDGPGASTEAVDEFKQDLGTQVAK